MPATPSQAWGKLPNESGRAYAAFCGYRDLGAERSIDGAYRAHRGASATVRAPGRWFQWSTRFAWVERAEAFDDHLASLDMARKQQAAEREAAQWAERRRLLRDRRWQVAQALLDKAESILRLPLVRTRLADGVTIVEPLGVRVADAARLGQIANELGSQAVEDAQQELQAAGPPKVVRAVFEPPWSREKP